MVANARCKDMPLPPNQAAFVAAPLIEINAREALIGDVRVSFDRHLPPSKPSNCRRHPMIASHFHDLFFVVGLREVGFKRHMAAGGAANGA